MTKRMTALALTLTMTLPLGACGGKTQTTAPEQTEETAQAQETEVVIVAPTGDLPTDRSYTVTAGDGFQEGLAKVIFNDGLKTYTGVIDKKGVLQFYYEGQGDMTAFEDGQAMLKLGDRLLLVDENGKLLHDYTEAVAEQNIEAYGGGYVIVEHAESDILLGDTKVYTLIDASGKETTIEGAAQIAYLSDGVFSMDGSVYYFARTGLRYQMDSGTMTDGRMVYAVDDILYSTDADGANPQEVGSCESMAASGLLRERMGTITPLGVVGSTMVVGYGDLREGRGGLAFLNTDTGVWSTYQGKYAALVNELHEYPQCRDGKIGIPIEGKDDQRYLLLLDETLKELGDPVPIASSDYIWDGDDLVSAAGIYDRNGKQHSDGTFLDLSRAMQDKRVGDGAVCTKNGIYYQYDGTLLFDAVDFTQAKQIALPQADESDVQVTIHQA